VGGDRAQVPEVTVRLSETDSNAFAAAALELDAHYSARHVELRELATHL
jgi:hypothetical protein